jgi:hypothetical protein
MGQYGNQPDFGTRALNIDPTGDIELGIPGQPLKSAALYIGTGGTLWCAIVGNDGDPATRTTVFKNIPDGTFFPVIVNNVWQSNDGDPTTCSDIVALY